MFDRLGRKEDETPFVVEWFVNNGIEVWSVNEGEQRFDKRTSELMALKDEIVKVVQGTSKFSYDLLNEAIDRTTQEQKLAEHDVIRLTDEYSDSERIISELKLQHNRLLNWADIFNDSEMEVKKMIIAHLIEKITVSRGNQTDVTFSISAEQYLNYQQKAKKLTI
ncbi:MAG: hypothetical protein PHH84_05055 [Oscillospiraceae bacterium]|nr:hypothetical protein [Oscillospiraceae bacterium]